MLSAASKRMISGIVSNLRRTSRSVVPPIPRDVFFVIETPGDNSAPSSASLAAMGRSLIRMKFGLHRRNFRAQQHSQLVEHATDAPRADGQNRVAELRFAQDVIDPGLHGAFEDHVLVPGAADGLRQFFSGNAI